MQRTYLYMRNLVEPLIIVIYTIFIPSIVISLTLFQGIGRWIRPWKYIIQFASLKRPIFAYLHFIVSKLKSIPVLSVWPHKSRPHLSHYHRETIHSEKIYSCRIYFCGFLRVDIINSYIHKCEGMYTIKNKIKQYQKLKFKI